MNAEAVVAFQIAENDKIIDKGYLEAHYDGNNLDMIGTDGDKITYMQMSKDEIMDMLATKSSHIPLEERLMVDYPIYSTSKKLKSTRRRKPTPYPKHISTTKKSHTKKSHTKKHASIPKHNKKSHTKKRSPTIKKLNFKDTPDFIDDVITRIPDVSPIVRDTPGAHKK